MTSAYSKRFSTESSRQLALPIATSSCIHSHKNQSTATATATKANKEAKRTNSHNTRARRWALHAGVIITPGQRLHVTRDDHGFLAHALHECRVLLNCKHERDARNASDTTGCLSFGPIEKNIMFFATSACARRTGAAACVERRRHER